MMEKRYVLVGAFACAVLTACAGDDEPTEPAPAPTPVVKTGLAPRMLDYLDTCKCVLYIESFSHSCASYDCSGGGGGGGGWYTTYYACLDRCDSAMDQCLANGGDFDTCQNEREACYARC